MIKPTRPELGVFETDKGFVGTDNTRGTLLIMVLCSKARVFWKQPSSLLYEVLALCASNRVSRLADLDFMLTTTSRDTVDKRTLPGNRDSKPHHAARWFGKYLTLCRKHGTGKVPRLVWTRLFFFYLPIADKNRLEQFALEGSRCSNCGVGCKLSIAIRRRRQFGGDAFSVMFSSVIRERCWLFKNRLS